MQGPESGGREQREEEEREAFFTALRLEEARREEGGTGLDRETLQAARHWLKKKWTFQYIYFEGNPYWL